MMTLTSNKRSQRDCFQSFLRWDQRVRTLLPNSTSKPKIRSPNKHKIGGWAVGKNDFMEVPSDVIPRQVTDF